RRYTQMPQSIPISKTRAFAEPFSHRWARPLSADGRRPVGSAVTPVSQRGDTRGDVVSRRDVAVEDYREFWIGETLEDIGFGGIGETSRHRHVQAASQECGQRFIAFR